MAFTYTDPSNSDEDAVRFLSGDTDSTKVQLQDAEITYLLTQSGGNVYLAASSACLAIAALYARLADKEVGDLVIDYSQRQQAYLDLADKLNSQAARKSAPSIYVGGTKVSEKELYEDDTDLVQPTFERDMFSNPSSEELDLDADL